MSNKPLSRCSTRHREWRQRGSTSLSWWKFGQMCETSTTDANSSSVARSQSGDENRRKNCTEKRPRPLRPERERERRENAISGATANKSEISAFLKFWLETSWEFLTTQTGRACVCVCVSCSSRSVGWKVNLAVLRWWAACHLTGRRSTLITRPRAQPITNHLIYIQHRLMGRLQSTRKGYTFLMWSRRERERKQGWYLKKRWTDDSREIQRRYTGDS